MKKIIVLFLLLAAVSFVKAQETATIYIGSKLVKCGGMLDVMCMPMKKSVDAAYEPFMGPIEDFTYEEGYEYKLSVYIMNYENPVEGAPKTYYKLRKILSKKYPQVTLYIANRTARTNLDFAFPLLVYRENESNAWDTLYKPIKGFTHKEGYEYKLLVTKKLDPMSGGALFNYSLVKVLEKKPTMIISGKNRAALDKQTFSMTRYYENGTMNFRTNYPKPVTLTFNLDENNAAGDDGCNQMSARIEINGQKISFGPIMATKMFCVNVTIDRLIQQSLSEVNRYKISNGVLELYDGDTLLLEYQVMKEDLLKSNDK